MKLAFVAEMFFENPFSGIAVWTKRLSNFLKEHDIENQIFSFEDVNKFKYLNKIGKIPNVRELLIYPRFGATIGPGIDFSYDLIHFASPFTTVKYHSKVNTITTIHYIISRQIQILSKYLPLKYKLFFNPILFWIFKRYETKGLSNTNFITVVRKSYKDYLIQNLGVPENKIMFIPNAVDADFFQPNKNGLIKEPVAVFVGRGSLAKGFDTLLQAAPKINGKIVVVLSKCSESLKKIAESIPNIEIKMKLNAEAIRTVYQNSSVFVLPSLTEGNPISTLEAMSCGLPVVCTEEGGGENIENGINGYLFDNKDPSTLAEKVNYLFNHYNIASEFGRFNRLRIENENTMECVTDQFLNVYRTMC